MIKKISTICSEISELENKISASVQEELRPFLIDIMQLVREAVPQVKALMWGNYYEQEDESYRMSGLQWSFRSDTIKEGYDMWVYDYSYYIASERQRDALTEIKALLFKIEDIAVVAFGTDVDVKLDIDNNKLTISRKDNV